MSMSRHFLFKIPGEMHSLLLQNMDWWMAALWLQWKVQKDNIFLCDNILHSHIPHQKSRLLTVIETANECAGVEKLPLCVVTFSHISRINLMSRILVKIL